ncbi:JmjC domain-containing histone demethylation protein 1 [Lithohypha guttulata]|uniref:JmjC domain-containing histone demethylation protein 1 n=1 Tax=Lithohypha guttulata TaxID=1690604 RepID=UPI002DDEED8D|nr:JmjC domain-containing histone demethylation protein 1 [Lithohypha guttulata]KAK5103795.1 JmjC domain-containing histone demethylation protein 1 [Lithohypha guttulata]
MPTSTAWRRRDESTPRRGSSPARPAADSIERLSPEPYAAATYTYPATPPSTHYASRGRKESGSNSLQGLGLSHTVLTDRPVADHDHLYLDSNGRAHLGAKIKSPKHNESLSRPTTSRNIATQYRGPPKRSHTRAASSMSIDDLANIAIATSPHFNNSNSNFSFSGSPLFPTTSRPSTSYMNGYSLESFDRPAKRIKSERLYSTEWSIQDERPRSSYVQSEDARKEEAELLLGIQKGFSFKHVVEERKPIVAKIEPIQEETLLLDIDESAPAKVPTEEQAQQPTASEGVAAPESSTLQPQEDSITPVITNESTSDTILMTDADSQDVVQKEEDIQEPQPDDEMEQEEYVPSIQAATGTAEDDQKPSENPEASLPAVPAIASAPKPKRIPVEATQHVCPACNQINSNASEGESTIQWINCEGSCNRWFHIPCAGFTGQGVKKIAKFICPDCEPEHGQTTYTRTSSRARTTLDYAALNEGVALSNDDDTLHHFVPRFKNGSLQYHRDNFARIRPELLTQDLWENFDGMKRPFVVPALWNPRFGEPESSCEPTEGRRILDDAAKSFIRFTDNGEETDSQDVTEQIEDGINPLQFPEEQEIDVDQDYLDMVMPRGLTVPQVAELYGPDEDVPVIDVKTQETKGSFTLRKWATYYAERGIKEIKNVISLEVSHSRLGRLIRRPKVVRDVDLEDQVWDAESRVASSKRPVAFYCLMSVGDSYTDFHIDFGGSSVYYHILKGRKTFFFIPPEDKYLKEYEKWNNTPNQKQIWLGDWCNGNVTRVDLYPGDTAFIPAGWIHSVWTPEDSLVIGGNFLTRYDLDMQLKIANIERANGVPAKFRYPFFQKVMWYTLIKYLEDDPVPEDVIDDFEDDSEYRYLRALPVWQDQDNTSPEFEPDDSEYNARNYSKSELRGLPALRDYLYRTARIHAELPVVPGVSKEQGKKVKASIPKGHGDPFQLICLFAVWVAWKRGNEVAPDWLHIDPITQDHGTKERSRKAEKIRIPPERASTRRIRPTSPASTERQDTPDTDDASPATSDSTKFLWRRIACAACRKKKLPCRHPYGLKLEETAQQTLEKPRSYANVNIDVAKLARATQQAPVASVVNSVEGPAAPLSAPQITPPASTLDESAMEISINTDLAQAALERMSSQPSESNGPTMNGVASTPNSAKKGRSKACDDCRKSKRRCVHDEHGRVDPAKAAEPSKPRGSTSSKRPVRLSDDHLPKRQKTEDDFAVDASVIDPALIGSIDPSLGLQLNHFRSGSDVSAFAPSIEHRDNHVAPIQPPAQHIEPAFDPALVDPALMQPITETPATAPNYPSDAPPMVFPKLSTTSAGTPDVDKSFSPITAEDATDVTSKRESEEQQLPIIKPEVDANTIVVSTAQALTNGISHSETGLEVDSNSKQENHSQNKSGTVNSTFTKREPLSPSNHRANHRASPVSDAALLERRNGSGTNSETSPPAIKRETESPETKRDMSTTKTLEFSRADTATSDISCLEGNASEKLARELQAQEHGLRRRQGVRIS